MNKKSWYTPDGKWVHSGENDFREHGNILEDMGLVPLWDENETIKQLIKANNITSDGQLNSDEFEALVDEEYASHLADAIYEALSQGYLRTYVDGDEIGIQGMEENITPQLLYKVAKEYGSDPRMANFRIENRGWAPIHMGTIAEYQRALESRKPNLVKAIKEPLQPIPSDANLKQVFIRGYIDRYATTKH